MNFMWTLPLYSANNFQKAHSFRQNCQFLKLFRRNTAANTETSRIFLETTIKFITGTLIYKSNNNSYHDGTRAFSLIISKKTRTLMPLSLRNISRMPHDPMTYCFSLDFFVCCILKQTILLIRCEFLSFIAWLLNLK